jgi:ribosomal protein S18 acetylase RimI-like enzyme
MTQASPYVLRLAARDELGQAIAIDEAALEVYAAAGLVISLADDHPFVRAEQESWRRALEGQGVYFAMVDGVRAGFYALGRIDGQGHLEQLSVRPQYGRKGLGSSLLEHACELARARGEREVWLTTYAHMPWNRPFYERHGFRVAEARAWGEGIRAVIVAQREVLPEPGQRVAMVRRL